MSAKKREKGYILGGGAVADGKGLFLSDGALRVEEGVIREIGPSGSMMKGDLPFIDVKGRLILPGMVNFHHHLYSSFSPGLSPLGPTETFPDILENLWWPLDRAVNGEILYYSVLMGALDSLSHGVTTIFDHHASMNLDRGSLDIAAEALNRAGCRGVLCLETSDRQGTEARNRQVEENIAFWEKHRGDPFLSGMMGLHANFTLSEKSLALVAERKPAEMPIHIHCGESVEDFLFCRRAGYRGPADRLNAFGLLDGKSFLIHCVNLAPEEYALLDKVCPAIVLNPESNANNRVGTPQRDCLPDHLLGTDGMSGDMISALRSYYLLGRGNGEDFPRMERMFFSLPGERLEQYLPGRFGFYPGAPADIAVPDYIPLSPLNEGNILGHLLFGARGGRAFLTAVNGKILWYRGEFPFADLDILRLEARSAAQSLANRFPLQRKGESS